MQRKVWASGVLRNKIGWLSAPGSDILARDHVKSFDECATLEIMQGLEKIELDISQRCCGRDEKFDPVDCEVEKNYLPIEMSWPAGSSTGPGNSIPPPSGTNVQTARCDGRTN